MADSSPTNDASKTEPELARAIRLPHATAMVVGTIIGASIFVQPSEIAQRVPTIHGILLVWLVSGVLTLFGALVCAELASVFPRSGGVYVFLSESFGRPLGFLWGWAMFWTMHSGIIAAIALIFARYAGFFLPLDRLDAWGSAIAQEVGLAIGSDIPVHHLGQGMVAVAVILILSGVNLLGVHHGSLLQTVFTAGKLLAIAIIIIVGFVLGGGMPDAALQSVAKSLVEGFDFSLHDFALALVAGLFAFGGWHMVTFSAGETVDPRRTIPRALMIGTLIVTACYIALNAVYLYVLPLATVARSTRIAADLADAVLGIGGGAMMAVLVMFSTFGALAGIILSGPRVYYAMARDGVLFSWLGKVHPTRKTPDRAIMLQALWSCVLVLGEDYRSVFISVIYTEWIFFGLMALGLILLRKRTDLSRSYRVWGYPIVPIVFAISAFAIAINQIVSELLDERQRGESIPGIAIVLAGIPIYYLWTYLQPPRNDAL